MATNSATQTYAPLTYPLLYANDRESMSVRASAGSNTSMFDWYDVNSSAELLSQDLTFKAVRSLHNDNQDRQVCKAQISRPRSD
ncbi:MAG: hypothetical protein HAW66_02930 [Shewanella sp.]|nr:hypothetical protein [Shewanella sp.]